LRARKPSGDTDALTQPPLYSSGRTCFKLSVRTSRVFIVLLGIAVLAFTGCRKAAPVGPPPDVAILTTVLPDGIVTVPYSAVLFGTGGIPLLTWSISAGSLPPGLTLNATTGAITGTPTQVGVFNFTVTATDSSDTPLKASKDLSIDIRDAVPVVEYISVALGGGAANGDSGSPALNADGRYVVFTSFASNLIANDTNGFPDVFLRDRVNQVTERVSMILVLANQTADIFSPTTIGRSTLAMQTDEHVGRLVEIVQGTGAGQGRRVTANDATTLTVDAAWTTVPDATSVFRVVIEGNGASFAPAISADGRFVAYTSAATNFAPEDLNAVPDVFVTELDLTGSVPVPISTRRVSIGLFLPDTTADIFSATTIGNSTLTLTDNEHKDRLVVIVSGTGAGQVRWIASNDPTTLTIYQDWTTVPDATSVFRVISDATRGTKIPGTLADIFTATTVGNTTLTMTVDEHSSRLVVILAGTGKGQIRRILSNTATTLTVDADWSPVPDATSVFRVFAEAAGGFSAPPGSTLPFLTNDGQRVALQSAASTLVANDTTENLDIFLHDLATGQTTRVSVRSDGSEDSGDSFAPYMDANGTLIAFHSAALLVPEDTSSLRDIYLHHRPSATTIRTNLAPDGSQANSSSTNAALSPSGRFIMFHSFASNLVAGDTNGTGDVFLRDLQTAETVRVSLANDGSEGNASADQLADLSGAGRLVVFTGQADNLVSGDTNGVADVFLRDRQAGTTVRIGFAMGGAQPLANSVDPTISADGQVVAFSNTYNGFFPDDTNNARDVFAVTTGLADSPLIILPGSTTARRGQSFQLRPTAYGGEPPLFWTLAEGQLPPGLTLDPRSGEIRGVPMVAGTFRFTLLVLDNSRPRQTAVQAVVLKVEPR